ncbi:MAG: GNAT family N-acetyltransferase [Anaerolineaceae bacterium]|jgi:GNAT superfamily N-acetyltransferase
MMHELTFFSDAQPFLDRVLPDLAVQESRNNLILGLALRLKADPHAYGGQDPLMVIGTDQNEKISVAAIMTPPFPMIVQSDPVCLEGLGSLADALFEKGWKLPGVNGVAEASDAFAGIWQAKTGQTVRLSMRQRAYELRKVEAIDYPGGIMRVAEEKDAGKAADLLNAMMDEIGLLPGRKIIAETALINIGLRQTFFWEDGGEIVSITIANRPQIKAICISGVYTPPTFRRQGYARALVAEVSKEMFSRGFTITNLFTDLANPTSNKIYQEVGYKPVCDYHQYTF